MLEKPPPRPPISSHLTIRLFLKPEFFRWRNIDEEKWNANGDVSSAAIGYAAHGLTLTLNPNLDPSPITLTRISTMMGVKEGTQIDR